MRLGRSIAALGGALALVAAGAALTSPVAASDFRVNTSVLDRKSVV